MASKTAKNGLAPPAKDGLIPELKGMAPQVSSTLKRLQELENWSPTNPYEELGNLTPAEMEELPKLGKAQKAFVRLMLATPSADATACLFGPKYKDLANEYLVRYAVKTGQLRPLFNMGELAAWAVQRELILTEEGKREAASGLRKRRSLEVKKTQKRGRPPLPAWVAQLGDRLLKARQAETKYSVIADDFYDGLAKSLNNRFDYALEKPREPKELIKEAKRLVNSARMRAKRRQG